MKEGKRGKIPPCYGSLEFVIYEAAKKVNEEWERSRARHSKMIDKLRGKLMEGGFLDDTHDKVYGLNEQMCDIGKTMSDAELMMDDIVRRAEENIRLYNDNNKYARLVRAAYESKFGKPKEKDIMEEKKTRIMTKAEAFEYLKAKKVSVSGAEMNDRVQSKLFACGVQWKNGGTNVCYYSDYLVINPEGFLCHCDGMGEDYWNRLFHEEISADDILSIEIVEGTPKFRYEKVVELAKPLMHYLNEVACRDSIRVSQLGIVHEPMSTLIFDPSIGE